MEQVLKDEMIYIAGHTTESSFHLIGHLYLALDALIKVLQPPYDSGRRSVKRFFMPEKPFHLWNTTTRMTSP